MNKITKALGITAALAVMIPLSAYAATAPGSGSTQIKDTAKGPAWADKGFVRKDMGRAGGFMSQEVLDLLKLDQKTLQAKLEGGKTLAQVAEEQGVTRDQLKQTMTDAFNKQLEERKQQFSDNLDKMLDSKGKSGDKSGGKMIFMKKAADLSAITNLLGVTNEELKQSLSSGKTIADLAKEKNIDVQTLIDAQKNAIVASINQAVKNGSITQEQADKQIANAGTMAEKLVNGKLFMHENGKDGHHKGLHSQEQSSTPQTDTQSGA